MNRMGLLIIETISLWDMCKLIQVEQGRGDGLSSPFWMTSLNSSVSKLSNKRTKRSDLFRVYKGSLSSCMFIGSVRPAKY